MRVTQSEKFRRNFWKIGVFTLLALGAAGCGNAIPGLDALLPRTTETPESDFSVAPQLSYPAAAQQLTRGVEVEAIRPISSGGTPLRCSATPLLPAGIQFEDKTCAISGRPILTSQETSYLIAAENPAGATTSLLRLTVAAPPELKLIAETRSIEPLSSTLLHVEGGYGTFKFSQVSGQGRFESINAATIEYFAGKNGGAASLAVSDDAGQVSEATVEIIPPSVTSAGQTAQLDAARATGDTFPGVGCAHKAWSDLSPSQQGTARLLNFSSCNARRGWNGAGTAGDPYRLTLEGKNNQRASLADRDEQRPEKISIEAWFRTNGWGGYRPVVMKTNSETWADGYGLYLDPNGNIVFFTNGWDNAESMTIAPIRSEAGQWVHAVASFDGQTSRLYVNGALAASREYPVSVAHSREALSIGGLSGYTFSGDISAIGLYDRALSPIEVRLNCLTRRDRFAGSRCGEMVINPSSRTAIAGRTYSTEARGGVAPYTAQVERGSAQVRRLSAASFLVDAPALEQENIIRIIDSLGYSRTQNMRVVHSVPEVTDGALATLDAARATANGFPGSGCEVRQWRDLSTVNVTATLKGFDHCSLVSGWNGNGKSGDPYRLTFDGRTDEVLLDDSPLYQTANITYEAWYRAREGAGDRPLLVRTSGKNWNDGAGLYLDNNVLSFFVNEKDSDASKVKMSSSTLGNYAHVVGTYDGTRIRLYLNGRLVRSKAYSQPLHYHPAPVRLGSAPGALNYGGQIVRASIYGRALSSEEIRSNCLASQNRFLSSVMCW